MGPRRVRRAAGPRVGVVFGAGGVLGAAWMTGALPALQEHLPCPLHDVDVMAGTSAGSVVAAALRCRVSIEEMVAYQRGEAVGVLAGAGADGIGGGPWPPAPQLRLGSPKLMLTTLLQPHRVHPWVGASACLPLGRASHGPLHAMVHALHSHAHRHPAGNPAPPGWVQDTTWIVAVDYDTGRRVVFGREDAPAAGLPDAVVASCSIPGWYAPAVIAGRRYVDGGVRSATSLGIMARAGVDEVYVLAPMASIVTSRPRKPHERLERRFRALMTLALLREAKVLRSLGIRVHLLTPGPQDVAAMGVNLMDPRRRRAVLETSLYTSAAELAGRRDTEPKVA
jgi:NTE family protein